jgi:hypothetical protein
MQSKLENLVVLYLDSAERLFKYKSGIIESFLNQFYNKYNKNIIYI